MVARGYGRIVNISSIWSLVAKPGRAAYSVSKSGLNGLTRSLAVEVAARNVMVNAIAPGFIATQMTYLNNSTDEVAALVDQLPAGRLEAPAEIAESRRVLRIGPQLSTTGQVIVVRRRLLVPMNGERRPLGRIYIRSAPASRTTRWRLTMATLGRAGLAGLDQCLRQSSTRRCCDLHGRGGPRAARRVGHRHSRCRKIAKVFDTVASCASGSFGRAAKRNSRPDLDRWRDHTGRHGVHGVGALSGGRLDVCADDAACDGGQLYRRQDVPQSRAAQEPPGNDLPPRPCRRPHTVRGRSDHPDFASGVGEIVKLHMLGGPLRRRRSKRGYRP